MRGHSIKKMKRKFFSWDECMNLREVNGLRRHDGDNHLLVLEGGGFSYLSVPPILSKSVDEGKLCFLDHQIELKKPMSDMCCLREAGHVHAHVHHGDITEDILLEQANFLSFVDSNRTLCLRCLEEEGCTLPMPCDMGSLRNPILSGDEHDADHEHQEGCGHNRIAHGDHFDWLVPLKDGSYVLSHPKATDHGGSQFIEHGRLVKVGESLGQLKKRPKQLVDLFTYESPNRSGYEILQTKEAVLDTDIVDVMHSPSIGCKTLSSVTQAVIQEDVVNLTIPRSFKAQGMTKTTFDVMNICCPSEVPLVKKILATLPGVEEVLVNPTSKIVIVLHDPKIVADLQLVKILNQARLDASIHQRGKRRIPQKWPSPWTIGSGILLFVSLLHYVWSPLKWVALGSVALGVPQILVRSLVALRRCVLDINALMLIAVGGAIALGDYVEAGSICFLFTLADWLESRSSDKARDAISNVADLAPQTAVLIDGQRVGVEDVGIGTLLIVKAGELIPIDGEVVSGKSSIDESNVTGESKPVEKMMGALLWAGTMNLSGYISLRTTALAEDSAISRMVQLVEEAQNQHSRTEQLVQKAAKYYTPVVVASAILIAVIPWAAGSHHHKHWIYLALVLLVVSCPCALVISTPVTTTCGIAQAARSGLLVRGGSHLEALAKVKVLALDKTGTVTEGHFRVLDVHPADSATSVQEILYWIACVESKSSHPLAPALVAYALLRGVEPTGDVSNFEIIPGLGVSAVVDGHKVQIGNARLAANFVGFEGANSDIVETWGSLGATIGWVGVNGRPVGVFGVADSLRPEASEAVAKLKHYLKAIDSFTRDIFLFCGCPTRLPLHPSQKLGVRVVMLTGDSSAAASNACSQIGDIEVHSELLPEDKVKLVKEFKEIGVTVMVGDGINDAPALALADIGIAMGVAGSAIAMETADVGLMTNDLRKLAVAIKLGRNVRMKIFQNVSLSFLTKITIIILAAVGYPSLWAAVLADVGTCLVVIFNSMWLLNRNKGSVLPKFESKGHLDWKPGNHKHVHHDHQELDRIDSHHQGLGKSRDNDHHHHNEVGNFGGSHHNMPKILAETRGNHSDELGKAYEHDHRAHKMIDHGVKVSCWPLEWHRHSKEQSHAVTEMSDKTLTIRLQPVKGWSSTQQKLTFHSGTTAKSRAPCTTDSFESECCADTGIFADYKYCQSVNKNKKGWLKAKEVCGSPSGNGPDTKCGRKPVIGKGCFVDSSCCLAVTEHDIKHCSMLNLNPRASQGAADGMQCCFGQDRPRRVCLNANTKLPSTSGSECSLGQEYQNCCSSIAGKSEIVPRNQCCSEEDEEKKRCSNLDIRLDAGLGRCHPEQDKVKVFCSNLEKKLKAVSGSEYCSRLAGMAATTK